MTKSKYKEEWTVNGRGTIWDSFRESEYVVAPKLIQKTLDTLYTGGEPYTLEIRFDENASETFQRYIKENRYERRIWRKIERFFQCKANPARNKVYLVLKAFKDGVESYERIDEYSK